jgi:hypothetical protein
MLSTELDDSCEGGRTWQITLTQMQQYDLDIDQTSRVPLLHKLGTAVTHDKVCKTLKFVLSKHTPAITITKSP